MNIFTARHLVEYMKCPRRCAYSWDAISEPIFSDEVEIIKKVIKYVYLDTGRTGYAIKWRHIMRKCEQLFTEKLGTIDDSSLKSMKTLIAKVNKWYSDYYLKEYFCSGYPDFPIRIGLGTSLLFQDTLDLLTLDNKIKMYDFYDLTQQEDTTYSNTKIYADPLVHIRAWAIQELAEQPPSEYVRIVIRKESIHLQKIQIIEGMINNISNTIRHITRGIGDNIFYPSFSEQCIRCPFSKICSM